MWKDTSANLRSEILFKEFSYVTCFQIWTIERLHTGEDPYSKNGGKHEKRLACISEIYEPVFVPLGKKNVE